MKRREFNIHLNVGDTAWFFDGQSKGLTSGEVVGVVERYNYKVYVIEVETHIDPVYHARTDMEVSDTQDKPIGLWRWLAGTREGV